MSYYRHTMTGKVELHVIRPRTGVGRSLTYQVVFLDPRLEATLEFGRGNRLRIDGEVEEIPVNLAWMPAPGRGHYLMIAPVVKALGLRAGDEVTVRFNPAPDDSVKVPEELAAALARSARRRALWRAQTSGRQRSLATFVTAVKSPLARAARVEKMFDELQQGRSLGPPPRGRARGPRRTPLSAPKERGAR